MRNCSNCRRPVTDRCGGTDGVMDDCAKPWPIVAGRRRLGDALERAMSHQPPKESKKKPQHTPKEKKMLKQQKKHMGDTVPFIKH